MKSFLHEVFFKLKVFLRGLTLATQFEDVHPKEVQCLEVRLKLEWGNTAKKSSQLFFKYMKLKQKHF
jgi:hypothetical protein